MLARLTLWSLLAQNPGPTTMAAPSWATVDVKNELATLYADRLAQALRENGFKVITASEIHTMLSEQRQLQLLGCTADGASCMTELANALGAELTLTGSIARLDQSLEIHLKVLRASTGTVLTETAVSATGEKALLDELAGAARRIAAELRPPSRRSLRPWATLPFVAGLAGAGAGAYLLFTASRTYSTLEQSLHTPADARDPAATTLASAGNAQQVGGWLALGVGIAALVVAVGLLVFGGAT